MQRSPDEQGGVEPLAPQDAVVVAPVAPDPVPVVAVEPVVPAPPPRTLTTLLDDYEAHQPADARFSRERLEHAIEASPVLKTMLQQSIAGGYLDRFTFGDAPDGAGGSYSPGERSMNLNASSFRSESNLVFVLGHETQHSLSLQGQAAPYDTALTAAIAARAALDAPMATHAAPRDYTDAVRDVVEGTRREEAQAHIGGFNALASYVQHERGLGRAPTAKELYQTEPGRMSDFIDASGISIFRQYALKPGLAREADGSMALSDGNIDRMKVYYADKFPGTFGENGLMDYRNHAIHGAWREIQTAEQRYVDHHATLAIAGATRIDGSLDPALAPLRHAYKIDFAALGASPALLKLPAGGVVDVIDTQYAIATRMHSGKPMEDAEIQALQRAVDPLQTAVVPNGDAQRALNRRVAIDAPPEVGGASAPEPALLGQARQAMDRLGTAGLGDATAVGNASAALAVEAQKGGLTAIDHVLKSVDGSRLIAVQGQDPTAAESRHVAVEIAQATRQPAEQSLQALQPQAPTAASEMPAPAPKGPHL